MRGIVIADRAPPFCTLAEQCLERHGGELIEWELKESRGRGVVLVIGHESGIREAQNVASVRFRYAHHRPNATKFTCVMLFEYVARSYPHLAPRYYEAYRKR